MIDQHAHPFSLRGGPLDLAAVSLDVRYDADADRRRHRDGSARLFQELMTVRLSERLGCDAEDLAGSQRIYKELKAFLGLNLTEWPATRLEVDQLDRSVLAPLDPVDKTV